MGSELHRGHGGRSEPGAPWRTSQTPSHSSAPGTRPPAPPPPREVARRAPREAPGNGRLDPCAQPGALGPLRPPPRLTHRGACAGGARHPRLLHSPRLRPAIKEASARPAAQRLPQAPAISVPSVLGLQPPFSSPWTPTAPAPPVSGPGPGLGMPGVLLLLSPGFQGTNSS